MSHEYNQNPTGKNQYVDIGSYICEFFVEMLCWVWHGVVTVARLTILIAKVDDPVLVEALHKYHRQKIVSNEKISELLKAAYNSPQESKPSLKEAERVVVREMNKNIAPHRSVRNIQYWIAFSSGKHLARYVTMLWLYYIVDWFFTDLDRNVVSEIIHAHDSDGFAQ